MSSEQAGERQHPQKTPLNRTERTDGCLELCSPLCKLYTARQAQQPPLGQWWHTKRLPDFAAVHVCVYIYIYIERERASERARASEREREREREKERERARERERERERERDGERESL